MMSFFHGLRLLFLCCFLVGCTIPGIDDVSNRVAKSLDGSLSQPADLDPAGTNSFTFSVFGDTHMGSPFGNVLTEAVAHSKAAGDSFIIVAGDLTDNGQEGSFDDFLSVFSSQSMEFRAAIGNHDVYFSGWSSYQEKIGRATYTFNADNVQFFVLDTANGVIGDRQFKWLETQLESSSQTIKVIVTHFSPYTGEIQSVWRLASDEESAILKDMAYRHNVNLVIAGHYHGYVEKSIGDTIYLTTGGVNKLIDLGNHKHYSRVTINGTSLSVEKVRF